MVEMGLMMKKINGNNRWSKRIGYVITFFQLIASIVFFVSLYKLGMLPNMYLVLIAEILAILLLIMFLGQYNSKRKAIFGKLLSILMSVVLVFASTYVFKANGAVEEISSGGKKLDKVVVAVLKSDPAETIKDAKDYNFGVQYQIKSEEIHETIDAINDEVGASIKTTECSGIQEQSEVLNQGNGNAIIVNEAYLGLLEDESGDFSDNIKIIYSHEIETDVDESVLNASQNDITKNPFIVYISGIDVYGAIETNSRSDVNILAVVNPTSHQILLVTTPRDFYVEFPGVTNGQLDKLTHAGIYGVDVSMATLGKLYDADIDFYARVNFTSLVEMVDALGGIDVNSEYAFTTVGGLNVSQGMNHFNGKQALSFSRERKNLAAGDFQRGKNQQAVITAMIQKIVSPAILTGASDLIKSVAGNVDTNMSQEQIQSLIKSQLANPQSWKIKSIAAEGTGDMQICYSMPSTPLYVTQPNPDSVNNVKSAISSVLNGETFDDSVVTQ